MTITNVRLDDLKPYDKNTKKHNQKQIDNVAASIKEYGFVQPLVIDENGVIVIGHCRALAAKKLKMKEVPCVLVEDLTPEQVRALRIVDNKTNESAWDLDLLAAELPEVDLSAFDFTWNLKQEDEDVKHQLLSEQFIVPPFTVLDSRSGDWNKRKQLWNTLIQDDGSARGGSSLFTAIAKFGIKSGTMSEDDAHVNGSSILDAVLAEIIVTWYMPKAENGVKVFDNFAGDTVFGAVAATLGKDFTGIELREEQQAFNNGVFTRLGYGSKHYICDDGRNVDKHIAEGSQDLFFSCPPYYNLEKYSDLENDASNQETYEDFYALIDEAFTKAAKCLKNNRFAVVVASDIRNNTNGAYYPFCDDIKATFRRNGFYVYNELIMIRHAASGALLARRQMDTTRKNRRIHEGIMVFYKGDTDEIADTYGDDFLDYRANTATYDNVMVFYNGEPKTIKKDFGEVKAKNES